MASMTVSEFTIPTTGQIEGWDFNPNVPEIKVGKDKVGSTGYLDRFVLQDLQGNPVVKGVDPHGRSFLVMAVQRKKENGTWDNPKAACVFQRYHHPDSIWTSAGECCLTCSAMTADEADFIKKLVEEREAGIFIDAYLEEQREVRAYRLYR